MLKIILLFFLILHISYAIDESEYFEIMGKIEKGDSEYIIKLKNNGFNFNDIIDDRAGETYLIHAVRFYQNEIVKILINFRINKNIPNGDNKTPIQIALQICNKEAFDLLKDKKINLKYDNENCINWKGNETFYFVEYNPNGLKLTNTKEYSKIYLGNSCDVISKEYGKGNWKFIDYDKGTFEIIFNDKENIFFEKVPVNWKVNILNNGKQCK